MKELQEKMLAELEEFGSLHTDTCASFMEDECDCDMGGMKDFVIRQMEAVNIWWCKMAEAHRPYCKPEGNKMLTRMMGKKNRPALTNQSGNEEQK